MPNVAFHHGRLHAQPARPQLRLRDYLTTVPTPPGPGDPDQAMAAAAHAWLTAKGL